MTAGGHARSKPVATSLPRVADDEYGAVLRWAIAEGLLGADDPSAIFVAFDALDDRLDHLCAVFPPDTLHAVAIKSNPLLGVLRHLASRGVGLEAASFEEVLLAKRSGVANERIVFDSPAKRPAEIAECEARLPGMIVNANSLEELARLRDCRRLQIGLRINPLAATDAPAMYDVSTSDSKFGEPISRRRQLIAAFLDVPQLTGLHVHVGSEVRSLTAAATAVASVFELAGEIDATCARRGLGKRVRFVDVGGGAAVNYGRGGQPGLGPYVRALRSRAPQMSSLRVITEYGRFVHAHSGWLVTDVEYVLRRRGKDVLVLHHGADMFVREVYAAHAPRHEVRVFDREGNLRSGRTRAGLLAGPLCFAGDVLGVRRLPAVRPGDRLVIADVGANSFALWSKHCSRAFPKVIGYSLARREIRVLKRRQTAREAIDFWA